MIDYDPHNWRDHLLDIHGSMVKQIAARVLACVVMSVFVVYLDKYAEDFQRTLGISDKPHIFLGTALGLLLVFRTNSSYDRFWEGRKQWGAIINETRNVARSASVWLAAAPDLLARAVGWTIVFPYATMYALRGEKALGGAAKRLPAEEVKRVQESSHWPLAVARQITQALTEARNRGLISDYLLTTLDQNVQLLIDYMGACERIHKTPLPFAYAVHLRRAIILYCWTLPFAFVDTMGWQTVPATLIISYILYGIEEIGVEIEDPFGLEDNDLPLERFCTTIENNLLQYMPQQSTPV